MGDPGQNAQINELLFQSNFYNFNEFCKQLK